MFLSDFFLLIVCLPFVLSWLEFFLKHIGDQYTMFLHDFLVVLLDRPVSLQHYLIMVHFLLKLVEQDFLKRYKIAFTFLYIYYFIYLFTLEVTHYTNFQRFIVHLNLKMRVLFSYVFASSHKNVISPPLESYRLERTPDSDSHHWLVEVPHVTSQSDDFHNFLFQHSF